MYNTGGRVQELADLTVADLYFDSLATVKLTGKGKKTRVIPLWQETVECLQHYIALREEGGIEAGNDIAVVKDWLGHADVKTTILYVEVSIERKRKALEKLPPPDGGARSEAPKWKQPDLMKFLNKCSNKARYVA